MMFLSRSKIGTRLQAIVLSATLGIVVISAYSLFELRSNLFEDRRAKAEDVVGTAHKVIEHFAAREKAGEMSRADAQKAAMRVIRDLRYGDDDYFWIQDLDLNMLMHPIKPEMEGKNFADGKDAAGTRFYAELGKIVRSSGKGFVAYVWPKPGAKEPSPKISFAKGYAPWNWFVASGIYVDDVERIFWDTALVTIAVVLAIAGLVGGGSLMVARGITRPIGAIARDMLKVAGGDKSVVVEHTDQKNEIGDLSRSMQTFLDKTIEMDRMRAAQEEKDRQSAAERKALLADMANRFESSVGGVVDQVGSASSQLQGSAEAMAAVAEETTRQAAAVAAASEQASANVQTVASAAEELTASISEIGRQVTEASTVAGGAVRQAEEANAKIMGLSEAAQKIGEVVALITDIANQTNLLALNATIEAARAGDAGKGFAVVASEVKNLANQTARATGDIAAQIASVQGSTNEAVAAIREISKTVGNIHHISSAIAAAVEEQSAATQEIARNIEQASAGTQEVSSNIAGVNSAAGETGRTASEIRDAAATLTDQSRILKHEVDKFLATVNAS